MTNRQPWTPADYGPITGSGAAKLADSAVAPLVAAARGYWTVDDAEGAKALAERAVIEQGAVSRVRMLKQLVVDDEDLLVLPWFPLADVGTLGVNARYYNVQHRPSRPMQDENGKTQKYKFFKGERVVLDVHPATPPEWLDSSLDVMLAEGLLKGDSALTAQLLDAGVDLDALSEVLATADARQRLNDLMREVPHQRRVPIINSASVTTWNQPDQWRHIRLAERRVIIAFDGDLAVNPAVWSETKQAMEYIKGRKGQPVLLSMFSEEVELAKLSAGIAPEDKLGMDDYLSRIGSWSDLMTLITDQLPPRPEGKDRANKVGEWRVHPENDGIVQEFAYELNLDGSKQPAKWHDRYFIGGRVVATIAKRRPTDQEIRRGFVDDQQAMNLEDAMCEIEVALLDPDADHDAEPDRYRIIGPATLLSLPPQDWIKHAQQIPNEVLNHPHWPPRKGSDWLSAVKAHRRDEVDTVTAWHTMGWVPVDGGHPAFIVGQQVLGQTERDEQTTKVGVTEHELPGASAFGVIDTFRDLSIEEYKAQVAADIKRVLQVFIENGFWRTRSTAVSILAAMLRPTIPMRPGITLYFVGPRRAGKSYSASFVLAGWQHTPGTWGPTQLNGGAHDTVASIEHAVAHSMLWVVDDLAPQVDRRKAEQQEAALSQIIRGVHNNSARRRMDGKTMTQREAPNPIALLVITAENPPQVPSIQERIISINIPAGAFNDSDDRAAENELRAEVNSPSGGAAARLTAAMIRLWQHDDTNLGRTWAERQTTLQQMYADECSAALHVLETEYGISRGEATRHANQIASLGLSLQVLYSLALWAGIDAKDPILAGFGSGKGSYMNDLYEMAASSIMKARKSTPGRSLVEALAKLLASGRAHLRNATTAGAPPMLPRPDDAGGADVGNVNESLGWEYDPVRATWVPRGIAIGYYGVTPNGDKVCLFDTVNAFNEAKRAYPTLIPHGQTAGASWESVWSEDLASAQPRNRDSVAARVRITADEEQDKSFRARGVPVLLDVVLDSNHDD